MLNFIFVITSLVCFCQRVHAVGDVESWTVTLKGHGENCNVRAENEFHSILAATMEVNLEWAEADPKWNDVCNPFKFFRCDTATERCICCNNDDGHLYFDPKSKKCRVSINGQCNPDRSVNASYVKPCFENPLFKPLNKYTPEVALPSLVECSNGKFVSKLDQLTKHLLEFGNNDLGNDKLARQKNGLGQGSPCNISEERAFHRTLRINHNSTDFSWLKNFNSVCNVFKYLRCDESSGKCTCWHEDLFWAPEEKATNQNGSSKFSMDFGRYKGRCRVAIQRQDSCSVHTPVNSVLSKYKKPFGLQIFDHIPEPHGSDYELKTLDAKGLRCVKNSWNHMGHLECVDLPNDPCKTDLFFLMGEMELLRKFGGKDTDWSFPPNDLCEEAIQDDFLRNNDSYTWNFDSIRDIIIKRETRDYCNPFIHQVCYRGICGCQRPIPRRNLTHGLKADRYVYRNNECIPEEGITCSRRYWYNGNWVEFLDECDISLKCVLAPDGLNHVCCDPEELRENRIPIEAMKKGRCRDQLLAYNSISTCAKTLGSMLHVILAFGFSYKLNN